MTVRRPLVITSSGLQELPTGDTLARDVTPTASKTSGYTAVDGDAVMCDATSGGFTVTLPAAGADKLIAVVKTDSSANLVTIARAGSDTIGAAAATSVTLALQGQVMVLLGRSGSWVILANYLDLGALDTRYTTTERAATRTLTNARITPRVVSTASTATLTIDSDTYDGALLTAQAAALSIANPTGTPTDLQKLLIRILDNGTARAITWSGSQWRAIGVPLPSTTVLSKLLYIGAIWNAASSKWDVTAVGQEA